MTSESDKTLRKEIEAYGKELAYLQRKCRELGIPVLVVVEGLSAARRYESKPVAANRVCDSRIAHDDARFGDGLGCPRPPLGGSFSRC